LIVAENLTIYYDGQKAVENVTFKLDSGQTLLLLGPNGAGKTTLLRAVAGLHQNYKGTLLVFGKPPIESRNVISYVPQSYSLNERVPLTAIEVVAMGALYKRGLIHFNIPRNLLKEATEALEFVGLGSLKDKRFAELSGGQKQRVLLARALISKPKLLLLDEPLSALDPSARVEVVSVLAKIKQEMGLTMIITTHDPNPLTEIGDRIMLLNKQLIAFGSPEEVLRDEIITKVYGSQSKAIKVGKRMYCFIGDVHLHRRERK